MTTSTTHAETVLRLELKGGGSFEIVRTPNLPDVVIIARDHKEQVIVDVTRAEANRLALALMGEKQE